MGSIKGCPDHDCMSEFINYVANSFEQCKIKTEVIIILKCLNTAWCLKTFFISKEFLLGPEYKYGKRFMREAAFTLCSCIRSKNVKCRDVLKCHTVNTPLVGRDLEMHPRNAL